MTANKDRIGVTKVLVEWNDYQSEGFGELIFTRKKNSRHSQVIAVGLDKPFKIHFSQNITCLSQKLLVCVLQKSNLNLVKTLFNQMTKIYFSKLYHFLTIKNWILKTAY